MRRLYILLCIAALLFGCTGGIEPDGNTGGIVPDENTGGGDNDGNGEGTGNEGDNGEDSGGEGGGNGEGGNGNDGDNGEGPGDDGNGNEGSGGEVTISFSDIEGTWMLKKWQGTTPSFSVYMEISPDGTIILWQKIDDYVWERYDSTATLNSNVISGTYSDNVSWSSSYSIEFEGEDMVWTDTEDESDVSVYVRADLPTIFDYSLIPYR